MPWLFEVHNTLDFNPCCDTSMARIVDADFWEEHGHFDDQHLLEILQEEFADFRGEELMEGVFDFDMPPKRRPHTLPVWACARWLSNYDTSNTTMHDLSKASLPTLDTHITGVESRKRLDELQTQLDQVRYHELQFQMQFVAFDKKERPHRFNDLPTKKTKYSKFMMVLVRVDPKGKEVEWYGPIWFVDPDKNGKKRYLTGIDLTRMHWYASKGSRPCPTVTLDRNDVGEDVEYAYMSGGGTWVRVPSITDEFGRVLSLYDINLW